MKSDEEQILEALEDIYDLLKPKNWEYTILDFKTVDDRKNIDFIEVNKLGDNGWELVSVINSNVQTTFFFKRQKL